MKHINVNHPLGIIKLIREYFDFVSCGCCPPQSDCRREQICKDYSGPQNLDQAIS
jgi:hypothetical protein